MALDHLVGSPTKVEKIAEGFTFTEGPVFSRIGFLLFTDVRAEPARILRWENGKVKSFRENSNRANGLTFDHQGRLLTCERDRVTRTEKDGSITVLASVFEGSPLLSPNDLVYAIDGSIYFSVIKPRTIAGPENPAVFRITRNGQVRLASRECTRPNGVALAPNQQRLFVADTDQRNVRVFDINGDGSLKSGRIFCQLQGDAPGGPDGLKTDESGNVWVAGPGGIWVFNAAGDHLGTVPLPETPSNCAWGAGFRSLYVTAVTSVYRIETKVSGTRTY
jgi:gluconolactonase